MTSDRRRSASPPDLAHRAHQSEHARPAPEGEAHPVPPASEVRRLPPVPDAAPAASPAITTAFEERLARWLADVARNGPRAA